MERFTPKSSMGQTPTRHLRRATLVCVTLICLMSGWVQAATGTSQFKQNGFEATLSPTPAWVELVQPEMTQQKSFQAGNVSYLLFDQQSLVADRPHHFYRIIKRANNASGLESASKLQVAYNPAFQTLMLHSANVYRDGELVYSLSEQDIKLFSNEDELEKEMLTGRASALVLLPGTRTGDVIDVQYSLVGANPIFGPRYSATFDLGWSVPLTLGRVRIVSPNSRTLNYKTLGADLVPVVNKGETETEWVWTLENPAPIYDEEQYPYGYDRYPYVAVSEYQAWSDVVAQQLPLYQDRTLPKDLLRIINKKLVNLPVEEQVLEALKLVQGDVRYLGLEYGVNAFKPHSPAQVWKDRRGDCKDKTLLLMSILDRLGIEAHPALVNTQYREGLRKTIPAPNRFDHVITHVMVNNQSYWLDPTNSPQSGDLENIGYHSYDRALLLKAGQDALTEMPLEAPENNRTLIQEEITISDYTAPVLLKVTSTFEGKSAEQLKAKFEHDHIEKIEREYIQFYEKQFGQILKAERLNVDYDSRLNRFTIVESYVVDQFFKRKTEKVNFDIAATSIKEYLHVPKAQNRNTPFYLGRPKTIQHQVKIHFPKEELSSQGDVSTVIETEDFTFRFDNLVMPYTYLLNYEFEVKDWVVDAEVANRTIEELNRTYQLIYRSFTYAPDSAFVDDLVGSLMRRSSDQVGQSISR